MPTEDGHSTLGALVDRLNDYRGALDTKLDQDQYGAVFDLDRHADPKNLASTTGAGQRAGQRGLRLAGSNPCFELWLLLHLTDDVAGIPSAVDDRGAAKACVDSLHRTLQAGNLTAPGYDKTRIGADRFATSERVGQASARARAMIRDPAEPWPSRLGTHVHFLVESLPKPLAPT